MNLLRALPRSCVSGTLLRVRLASWARSSLRQRQPRVASLSGTARVNERKGKHMRQYPVTFVCTNGATFKIDCTIPMEVVKLEEDFFTHAAWNRHKRKSSAVEHKDTLRGGQIGKFARKYEGWGKEADEEEDDDDDEYISGSDLSKVL